MDDVGGGEIKPAIAEGEARRIGASATAIDVAQQLNLIGDRIDPVQLFTDPDAVVLAPGDEVERALHVYQIAGGRTVVSGPQIEHPGAATHRINLPELTTQPLAGAAVGVGGEIEGVAHSREPGRVIAPLQIHGGDAGAGVDLHQTPALISIGGGRIEGTAGHPNAGHIAQPSHLASDTGGGINGIQGVGDTAIPAGVAEEHLVSKADEVVEVVGGIAAEGGARDGLRLLDGRIHLPEPPVVDVGGGVGIGAKHGSRHGIRTHHSTAPEAHSVKGVGCNQGIARPTDLQVVDEITFVAAGLIKAGGEAQLHAGAAGRQLELNSEALIVARGITPIRTILLRPTGGGRQRPANPIGNSGNGSRTRVVIKALAEEGGIIQINGEHLTIPRIVPLEVKTDRGGFTIQGKRTTDILTGSSGKNRAVFSEVEGAAHRNNISQIVAAKTGKVADV